MVLVGAFGYPIRKRRRSQSSIMRSNQFQYEPVLWGFSGKEDLWEVEVQWGESVMRLEEHDVIMGGFLVYESSGSPRVSYAKDHSVGELVFRGGGPVSGEGIQEVSVDLDDYPIAFAVHDRSLVTTLVGEDSDSEIMAVTDAAIEIG